MAAVASAARSSDQLSSICAAGSLGDAGSRAWRAQTAKPHFSNQSTRSVQVLCIATSAIGHHRLCQFLSADGAICLYQTVGKGVARDLELASYFAAFVLPAHIVLRLFKQVSPPKDERALNSNLATKPNQTKQARER
jgi:hypothetical protein